jgi:hypothetical protein
MDYQGPECKKWEGKSRCRRWIETGKCPAGKHIDPEAKCASAYPRLTGEVPSVRHSVRSAVQ